MGQTAHPGRATAAVGGLALLLATPLIAGCSGSLASAATTLGGVHDVQVVHTDGTAVTGVDGLRLRRGDLVRTGAAGRVELHTRGRVVYAGSGATVQVLDGARADLRHGAVVVDAQHGPGVTMSVAGLTVTAAGGTAVRAERAVTVRVAALAGTATMVSDTGRRLDVPALTQAVVGGDALPDTTAGSPLRLTDDDGEAHAVPVLVRDDLALDSLATGIDNTGGQTLHVVTAAWHRGVEPLPAGVARSEQVLPIVIAAAATGGDPADRYREAVALRRAGASWGVVAHRLGTTSAQVLAALDVFERGAATGQVGSVPAALLFVADALHPGAAGGGNGPAPDGTAPGGSSPGSSPGPQPSPSASSTPGVVPSTLDKVLSLLPTPLPSPASVLPSLPVALPTVGVSQLPVVGSVLTPVPAPIPHP